MGDICITHLDPWMKLGGDDSGMDRAIFVGRHHVDVGIDTVPEALFLEQSQAGQWRLWVVAAKSDADMVELLRQHASHDPSWRTRVLSKGLAIVGVAQAEVRDVAQGLVGVLHRSRFEYSSSCGPYHGGLLPAEVLEQVGADLHAEIEKNRLAALENVAPIIATAKDLGLNPQPSGHSPNAWVANCPSGGSHTIMISTLGNKFGCGYCRRKGGPDELRQFVEDRKRKRGAH